ncbi:HTTM domain-containing protein [Emticicia sp. CRIBPO]|uniref:HTTM domain-containing protein n=1 Tax=Emticicia sp. CRIBPO TaxID=2683258 RepID=UPI0014135611|nr:HTTM domain-containing protein [Emticicia sp. CRIBPO]NBA84697.1 HTTM domain-containing protein [Emticicia sp. CRIBPO]
MKGYFSKTVSAAPLAVFRMGFGLMIFAGLARFWVKGWITDLYITPKYFFPFFGFEFVRSLGAYTYLLFAIAAVSALMVAAGWFYRTAATTLFISFTYIELIDKSTYLNHYYFISLISFLLIFLPANVYFSVDAYRKKELLAGLIPRWTIDVLKVFVFILYFFAGLAKINSDWLVHALPLRIWLPARNDMPVIGSLFNHEWVWYAFSWLGCLYDLSIPFLLFMKKTRLPAFMAVVIFHGLTAVLFPIGMFPYIMIVTALIFFSGAFHQKIVDIVSGLFKLPMEFTHSSAVCQYSKNTQIITQYIFLTFFIVQLALPLRFLLYPGELFWTEEGYRFSWRVMLMEKAGYAQFTVKDKTGKSVVVNNSEFLTTLQEKMMSTQPDMILQYAHILRDYYSERKFEDPEVYVDSYVTLNGRLGKPLVLPETNLSVQKESFKHKNWITPFHDEIKGF